MSDETTRYEVRSAHGETLVHTETEQRAWAFARLWTGRTVHRVEIQVGPALPRPVEKWVVKYPLGGSSLACSKQAADALVLYCNEVYGDVLGPYTAVQVTP